MPKRLLPAVLTLAVLLLAGVAPAQEQLVIEGTGDSQQLLRSLARAFEERHPGSKVLVPDSVGSSGGVKALIMGKADLARIARPLKTRETAEAADLQARIFAYSPVVFAAHLPERCCDNITIDQIVGIYSGAISDWSSLGNCTSHKIYVAMREEGDSSRTVLEERVAAFKAIPEYAGKVIYSTPETVRTLEEYPYTIGYIPLAFTGSNLTIFAFDGATPSAANILNGSYPLATPFALAWRGELAGPAADFMAFLFSPEGRRIIRAAGLVPAGDRP